MGIPEDIPISWSPAKRKKSPITKPTLYPDEHGWHRKKICTKSLDIILLQVELPCLSFKVEYIYISEPLPNLYLHCLFVFVTARKRDRQREGSPGGAKILDSQHSFLKESIGSGL
jgi:hypothetical protein